MRKFFVCGAVLLVLALIGAVVQSMARMVGNQDGGILMSAYDAWYALWPGNLVVTKIRIERFLGAWAWDPVLVTALAAPAWALFGIPGAVMVWAGWATRAPRTDEDVEAEDSVFLFDSLAAQAKAEAAEFAEFQRTVNAGEFDDVVGTNIRVVDLAADAAGAREPPDDVMPDDGEPADDDEPPAEKT